MFRLTTLVLVLGSAACSGELAEREQFLARGSLLPPPAQGPLDAGTGGCTTPQVEALFRDSCGGIVCHGGPGTESGLDLTSPGVYGRLVGAPSLSCEGRVIVGDDVAASFLMEKLVGPVPEDCGDPMPQIGAGLTTEELACLEGWLLAQGGESEAP